MMKNNRLALLAALMGNIIFGLSFLFTKIALTFITPFIMLATRFFLAFLLMSILAVTGLMRLRLKGKKIGGLLWLGLINPVVYFFFESYGLKYVATSVVGVMLAFIPVVVMALGALFLKERPSLMQTICMLVSVGGVAAISIMGQNQGQTSAIGVLLIFGAVLSAAAYMLISRKLSIAFTPFERTYVTTGLGAVAFMVCAIASDGQDFLRRISIAATDNTFVLSMLFLAVVDSFIAFVLVNFAIGKMSVSRASSFANLTTVVSVAAGVLVLHESFSWWQAAASLLVILGVYGVNRAECALSSELLDTIEKNMR